MKTPLAAWTPERSPSWHRLLRHINGTWNPPVTASTGNKDEPITSYAPLFWCFEPLIADARETLALRLSTGTIGGVAPGPIDLFTPLLCQELCEVWGPLLQFLSSTPTGPETIDVLKRNHSVIRSTVSCIKAWTHSSLTMYSRFVRDRATLMNTLSLSSTDHVHSVHRVGDVHRAGHAVTLVTLSSGRRLLYKPRPMAGESVFASFGDYLNTAFGWRVFFLPTIVNRGQYGWSDFVEEEMCSSVDTVRAYYYRLGALLSALYVTSTTDIHSENIIAHGEYPVVVDLETLFQPRRDRPLCDAVWTSIGESVLRVGILQPPIGSDTLPTRMQVVRRPIASTVATAPDLYETEIVAGFQDAYGVIAQRREQVDRLLRRADRATVRAVRRPTTEYYAAMSALEAPRLLSADRTTRMGEIAGVVLVSKLFESGCRSDSHAKIDLAKRYESMVCRQRVRHLDAN